MFVRMDWIVWNTRLLEWIELFEIPVKVFNDIGHISGNMSLQVA